MLFAALVSSFGFVAVGAASATTDTTEPVDSAAVMETDAAGSAAPPIATSAESVSPEIVEFCEAELALEAAAASDDPEAMSSAFEAVIAAAPEELQATVEQVANGDEEAYGAMIEYMAGQCGFAEVNVAASEYSFGGIPEEVTAGPTIINLQNIGEEVHEITIFRVNDDVTLTVDELLALPEEESESMVTFVAHAFSLPGDVGHTVVELTPGRHVALCFFPEGTTPEVFEQMEAAEASMPESSVPDEDPALAEGSSPALGSTPAEGSTLESGSTTAEGEEPPPHHALGMVQEFTVV